MDVFLTTLGKGANNPTCEVKPLGFNELSNILLKIPTRVSDDQKLNQNWFIGGECCGTRSNDNVKNRSMLTFDIDEGFANISSCVSKIPATVNYVAYSTFSNNVGGKHSYRVVVPLASLITAKETYKGVVEQLNKDWFNGKADQASAIWSQCMFFGSMSHMSTFENCHNNEGAPLNWEILQLIPVEPIIPKVSSPTNNYNHSNVFALAKLCLDYIQDEDYQTWVSVGMALKNILPSDGYSLWLDWSSKQATFSSEHECSAKWQGFSDTQGYGLNYLITTAFGKIIINHKTLKTLDNSNKLHSLLLETINCRYVISENKIYDLSTKELYNLSYWNESIQLKIDTDNKKASAVLSSMPYFNVTGFKYNPQTPDVEFVTDNARYLNLYHDFRTKPTQKSEIIKLLTRFVGFIFKGENYQIFTQVLAHCYRYPNKKLENYLFIADICGGLGKTLIISAVCRTIGLANAKIKTTKDLFRDNFNADIMNSTLVFIDEVGMSDTNRRAETDKLKTITNNLQSSRGMYKEATTVETCYNLIMSANFYDAVLIDDNDRRCAVITTCWSNRNEFRKSLEQEFGQNADDFFKHLVEDVLNDLGGVAAWLESIPLNKDAIIYHPGLMLSTQARGDIINSGKSSINIAIENVLNDLGNPKFVDAKRFTDAVTEELDEEYRTGRIKALVPKILQRDFKFTHLFAGNDRIRIQGKKCTFYAHATLGTKCTAREHIKECIATDSQYR